MKNRHLMRSARSEVVMARRHGAIPKSAPCVICQRPGIAHHEDYAEPLDITWLCPKHHQWRHMGYSLAQVVQMYQADAAQSLALAADEVIRSISSEVAA